MTTEELLDYLVSGVPAFERPTLLGPGVGFHYTPHGRGIRVQRAIWGRPIGWDLAEPHRGPVSSPATDPVGVVFAYLNREPALREGRGMELFLLRYQSAISVVHGSDPQNIRAAGRVAAPQLLILAGEIQGFQSLGMVDDFFPQT